MLRALPIAFSCLAMPALACPTGADLDLGITIDFDDGASETYQSVRPNVVRLNRAFEGVEESRMDLGHGVFVLTYAEVYDGKLDLRSRMTTSYPGGLLAIPMPEAGTRFEADTVSLDSSGPFEETVSVAWGQATTIDVGGCNYAAIEGIIAYQGEETLFEGVVYLPDLGFGYLAYYEDSAGRDNYVPTAIKVGG